MAEDRRVKNNKKRILEAYVTCIERDDGSKITVKEICEIADINRSTFYAHYTDSIDLYHQILWQMLDDIGALLEEFEKHEDFYRHMRDLMNYFLERRRLILALLKKDDSAFRKAYLKKTREYTLTFEDMTAEDNAFFHEFYVSGFICAMEGLLAGDVPPDRVDHLAGLLARLEPNYKKKNG